MDQDRSDHKGKGLCSISDERSEGLREPFLDQLKLYGEEMGEACFALCSERLWTETPAVVNRGEAEAPPERCLDAL